MSKRTIVLLPGDGIGKTVLPEAVKVIEATGFDSRGFIAGRVLHPIFIFLE